MDYAKLYNALISFRKSNPLKKSKELYTEKHHIVPKCLGGSDNDENLVRLTAREHFIAHRLLAKMCPEERGLVVAIMMMVTTLDGNKITSSVEYSRMRNTWAEFTSQCSKDRWEDMGYRNLMSDTFRKRWLDPKFRDSMSINKSEQWKRPEYKEMMANRISESAVERWRTEEYRKNVLDAQQNFLHENPWPWQRQPKTKDIWRLATKFWLLSECNPENDGRVYGYCLFSKEFCGGEHKSIFQRMIRMFREGWNPHTCEVFREEYNLQ